MAQEINNWILPISLIACVFFGAGIVWVVTYSHYKTLKIAATSLAFGVIGALLLSTPKWTEIAIKWGDWEAKFAQLEDYKNRASIAEAKSSKLTTENVSLKLELAENETKVTEQVMANIAWRKAYDSKKFDVITGWDGLKAAVKICPNCPASSILQEAGKLDNVLGNWEIPSGLKAQ